MIPLQQYAKATQVKVNGPSWTDNSEEMVALIHAIPTY